MITLATWWLVRISTPEPVTELVVQPNSPDYFSTGYSKIEMDLQGNPKNKVVADKVTHYSDNDRTELENPVMTMLKQDAPPWVIRSEKGVVPAGGKDIYLYGKVFIKRQKAPGFSSIIVNTTDLRVKPEQNYAETDQWTELITPPHRTTGIGMEAYFAAPIRIKLLSNVRGKYE